MSVAIESPPVRRIPPLENGDRLSRAEFYRRWEAMPHLKHAERIEGVVSMQAAARRRGHSQPHIRLAAWLHHYEMHTPVVEAGDAGTIQADDDNDPQPDTYLLILPECGGQTRFTDDDYIEGAPEFIGEVAASSASRDLHQKLQMYERCGVREYLVWKTLDEELVWHRAVEGRFLVVPPDSDGVYRSTVFPGLWLDAPALLTGKMDQVFAVLDMGLATPQHAEFVSALKARRSE
jgi:Uma2 family endonuclease